MLLKLTVHLVLHFLRFISAEDCYVTVEIDSGDEYIPILSNGWDWCSLIVAKTNPKNDLGGDIVKFQ